jgi:hypothetical protein
MFNENNEKFYVFFLNMNQTNAFEGYVGLGFRKLSDTETSMYCSNGYVRPAESRPPFGILPDDYENDFHMRVITSGCYFMDMSSGNWSSDGLEISKSSGVLNSVCSTTHLTVNIFFDTLENFWGILEQILIFTVFDYSNSQVAF